MKALQTNKLLSSFAFIFFVIRILMLVKINVSDAQTDISFYKFKVSPMVEAHSAVILTNKKLASQWTVGPIVSISNLFLFDTDSIGVKYRAV